MGSFGITYSETYQGYYKISGDSITTEDEAEEELRRQISEGILHGPEECCYSSCKVENLEQTSIFLLISASAGNIQTEKFRSLKKAQSVMRDKYQALAPFEWDTAYEDLSYISDREAVLYANGDDVYTWGIEEISLNIE